MLRTLAFATMLLLALPAYGQDLEKGLDAYDSGDYETALRELRPLAEAGDAEAQYNLGAMYARGWGVAQDYAEGVRWWRLAAEQGHAVSQYFLGLQYATGTGVAQNDVEAVRWWRLAAEQDHAGAQQNLDHMGQGTISYTEQYTEKGWQITIYHYTNPPAKYGDNYGFSLRYLDLKMCIVWVSPKSPHYIVTLNHEVLHCEVGKFHL